MTRDAFLDSFFGPGNRLDVAQVEQTPELRELVAELTDDLDQPAVLPRRTSDQEVEWFVLCGDEAELRRVRVELQGFVGPSYARWDGARATLDPDDPVERAVIEFARAGALRFRTTSGTEFRECWNALKLMRLVWRQRPAEAIEWVRTGAALVREFELAIKGGDIEAAAARVVELRRRGLLGPENLRFLEVRQYAAQRRWREIAEARDLPDLARIRRPWLVTEDLIEALYRVHLAPHEASADVPRAREAASRLIEELPDLFGARGPLRSADVVKAFALRHAVRGEREHLAELGAVPGLQPADCDWIQRISESLRGPPPAVRDARQALAEGDLDAALRLALDEPPSAARVELLIECAFELRTLEAAGQALHALDELDETTRAALVERRLIAVALDGLQALVQPSQAPVEAAPRTWTEWLRRLLEDPEWQAADAVAACGELEYSADDVVDAAAAEQLASLVEAAADSVQRQAFRDGLPRIVGWLDRQDLDPSAVRPVHRAILTVLAVDGAWGESSLEVAYNAADAVLRAGLDAQSYADLLEQLGLLWERMAARANVAWLADVLELLELYPGPRDQLVGFVAATAGRVLPFAGRLDRAVLDALARSCSAAGAGEMAEAITARAEEAEIPAEHISADVLDGRLVGIYTLSPQVAVRARDAIQRRFTGVHVEVDSSHVSTAALENLAATADYLIVSIRSAKHAATDAIERHRPRDLPTLIPRGRGSSRMVEALVTAVESAA